MTDAAETKIAVAILGAFPPQCQGVQEYCRGVAEALAPRCAVHALGFRHMYPGFLFPGVKAAMDPEKPPLRGDGLRVSHRLAWYNPFGWLWAGLRTAADVFHVQWWSLPLFPVTLTMILCMKLRGKPIVVTVHNVLPHEGGRAFVAAGRIVCRLADAVLVHSELNRRQLLEHYSLDAAKVRAIPMQAHAGPVALPPRSEARAALNIPGDAPVALCFGIIRPYKGIAVLLRAFAQVRKQLPQARLIIAGRPWEPWEPYARIIAEEGMADAVILRLDYVTDAEQGRLFAAADIIVLPYTHFDAQSAVGSQVLALGKPMLVTQVGGLPELVGQSPNWAVPPNDPPALAEALSRFFTQRGSSEAEFNAIAAQARAAASPDAIAKAHEAIYQSVLQKDK